MSRIYLVLFLLCTLFSPVIFAQDADVEAIKTTIQSAYVDGLTNEGDAEKIDKGFHPDFNLIGIGEDGSMWIYPIKQWKADVLKKVEEGKMPKTGDNKVSIKFLDVDITGTAAVAKIEFYVGTVLKYIDYIALYKYGEDWKIVNKIFYEIPEKK